MGRRGGDLVHVARAGPPHQGVRPGVGRCRPHPSARPVRTRPPLHVGRLGQGAGGQGMRNIGPGALLVLERLGNYPAVILNGRYDVLAFNRAYEAVIGDLGSLPFDERNVLWLIFTSPVLRELLVEWERVARTCVARFRARMANHASEPVWRNLVKRLAAASEDFTRIWGDHEVTGTETTLKRFAHNELGLLTYHATVYSCTEQLGNRFIAYAPADEVTVRRSEALLHLAPRPLVCSSAPLAVSGQPPTVRRQASGVRRQPSTRSKAHCLAILPMTSPRGSAPRGTSCAWGSRRRPVRAMGPPLPASRRRHRDRRPDGCRTGSHCEVSGTRWRSGPSDQGRGPRRRSGSGTPPSSFQMTKSVTCRPPRQRTWRRGGPGPEPCQRRSPRADRPLAPGAGWVGAQKNQMTGSA